MICNKRIRKKALKIAPDSRGQIQYAISLRENSSYHGFMALIELDSIDHKILEILGRNARIPNTELADEVGLTPAPCLRRVKRLEEAGVIEGYFARLNPSSLGLGLTVFVSVTLDRQTKGTYDTFAQKIKVHPEVLECYLLLGERDFLQTRRLGGCFALLDFLVQ